MRSTLASLIAAHPAAARAIGAPGRAWLSHGGLGDLADRTRADLRASGIGRDDPVAVILPNGPEMAAAFVAISGASPAAPLNPAYGLAELDFYLDDLRAKALVIPSAYDGPALEAAAHHDLRVLRLDPARDAPAGSFVLTPERRAVGAGLRSGRTGPDDVALILHTSGTTSRPKMVPLLHSNIAASAHHIGTALGLSSEDRCLNVMPLFHIHGLVGAVASSLAACGSIWCAPGFDALRFFGWLDDAEPTWYTAVPTMHQAILDRAPRNTDSIARARLRLIRSSSAALPPSVMRDLGLTFRAPVIESYGMTEAAHQMTSNPLPPRARKPGSVGIAAGPDVRIADETANVLLLRGSVGEVVIAGPNVTPGYVGSPAANARSFFLEGGRRWFRTGDQGSLDAEDYLHLTGRLKELINRGGEKISPLEVDAVLLDHPAIGQAVTFALPHPRLGEEVAAAVVLRESCEASEQEIRDFAAARLAAFKVPRRILFLDEIPKTATGKVQRIGLAERLGLGSSAHGRRTGVDVDSN